MGSEVCADGGKEEWVCLDLPGFGRVRDLFVVFAVATRKFG